MKKFKVIKTDYSSLEGYLNDLEQQGKQIYQILPSVEYNGTLWVIVYKE